MVVVVVVVPQRRVEQHVRVRHDSHRALREVVCRAEQILVPEHRRAPAGVGSLVLTWTTGTGPSSDVLRVSSVLERTLAGRAATGRRAFG